MLVLTRKLGESIAIDDNIKIVVVQIKGKQVRLGIKAPKETKIHREEVYQAIQDQNTEAVQASMSDIARLGEFLERIQGRIRHQPLTRVSPLSVPVLLEIGREQVYGQGQDMLLRDAAELLIQEATGEEQACNVQPRPKARTRR